jgi:four helix bundle protein
VFTTYVAHESRRPQRLRLYAFQTIASAVVTTPAPVVVMNTRQPATTFHAFNLSLSLIAALRPLAARLDKVDKDLARQLRRAGSSVALNLSEGRKRVGRDRLHLWRVADGSNDECRACLLVAQAWGHLAESDIADALALCDKLAAMCWRLTH